MNGFEATRRIMEVHPIPIVIISGSYEPTEVSTTFRAIEAGAVGFIPRPAGLGSPDGDAQAAGLANTVKLMAEVKVVRRWPRHGAGAAPDQTSPAAQAAAVSLIALGASTGGPAVVQTILSGLPADLPASVVLVQHIDGGFVEGFVTWLQSSTKLPIKLAGDGARLAPGHVHVAPPGRHLGVTASGTLALSDGPPEHGMRPAVSYLFRSLARSHGPRAAGVLLTGMGRDGAQELKLMKDAGAVTIAQDESSSVVHGMPGEAIRLGAARYVLPPALMAQILVRLATGQQEELL
ncbi:MAG: chemotaxis response regulator protein-glutamate methylesterase [Armatimonadetes bacterium]|nr:chemotaxis response regulator protein-glutamate methylesterase [Armatimonadota bacterium]